MGRRVPMKQLEMTEAWTSVDEVMTPLGTAQGSICRCIPGRGRPAHESGRRWKRKPTEGDTWIRAVRLEGGERPAEKTKTANAKRRHS